MWRKLEKCSSSKSNQAEDEHASSERVSNEDRGPFVYLRGMVDPPVDMEEERPWAIFLLPINSLYQPEHLKDGNSLFNHSLHHTLPYHFNLAHVIIPSKYAELVRASWVAFRSTIYFFSATDLKIYYLERNFDGSTIPFSVRFRSAGNMTTERRAPKLAVLDSKIYVFGSDNRATGNLLSFDVFEPYKDRFKGETSVLLSPFPSLVDCNVLFAVAMEKEKKIVVGWKYSIAEKKRMYVFKSLFPDQVTTGTALFVYDIKEDSWIKYEDKFLLNLQGKLFCQPIVVDNFLYGLDNMKLWAYDLDSKQYFEGPVEDYLFQHVLETTEGYNLTVSLFHLVGDIFRVTWGTHEDYRVLHCMTIQVIRTAHYLQSNRLKLRATVVSCQTFAPRLTTFLQGNALTL